MSARCPLKDVPSRRESHESQKAIQAASEVTNQDRM